MKMTPFSTLPSMVGWLNDLCEKKGSLQDFLPTYRPMISQLNEENCPSELIFSSAKLFHEFGLPEASIFLIARLILQQPTLPKAWELLGDSMEYITSDETLFDASIQICCYVRAADLELHGPDFSWDHEDLLQEILLTITQNNSLEEIFVSYLSFHQDQRKR